MNTIFIRYEALSASWVGDAVTGQEKTLKCKFIFDEKWDAYPIRYMIVSREGKIFDPVIIDGSNEAIVHGEALAERAHIMIGAVGLAVKNGKTLRYNGRPCRIRVDQGNLIWEPATEEEATAYEQLLVEVVDLKKTVYAVSDTLAKKMDATNPVGTGSFSMGRKEGTDIGECSHAEGGDTTASNYFAHAEGQATTASGWASHSEGRSTTASGNYSHTEGYETEASGRHSHAEGFQTTASGGDSHAEGYDTTASQYYAHAEGTRTTASGWASHAEGQDTTASGNYSHSEGTHTNASGIASHTEGSYTTASDDDGHAEGFKTTASGKYSHSEGVETIAQGMRQHVQGQYNIPDSDDVYAHIVGNGTSDTDRSNAHTLDWDGNAWYAGDVYVGSTSGTNMDEGSKKLATEEYVDKKTLTDTTLTVEGAVADAKAVGDKLAEKIPAPATAFVGQTIVVSAVDENGKPTAWEAADMDEKWRLIAEGEITENVESIEITEDMQGNPIKLKKAKAYAILYSSENKGKWIKFNSDSAVSDASVGLIGSTYADKCALVFASGFIDEAKQLQCIGACVSNAAIYSDTKIDTNAIIGIADFATNQAQGLSKLIYRENTAITKIKLAEKLKAGSVYKIWGVDA